MGIANGPVVGAIAAPGSTGAQGPQGNQGAQGAQGGGGGGGAGAPVVRKFPFAFNTAGILTGAALYTPTIGDILLDAWIEIDTAWDGTTPLGDFGAFTANKFGLFGNCSDGPVDMTHFDTAGTGTGGNLLANIQFSGVNKVGTDLVAQNAAFVASTGLFRIVPAKFTTTDPIKVVISQDGTNTGADPGSTVGAAILYLVTCTPV